MKNTDHMVLGKAMTCNSDERLELVDNHPFAIPHSDMVLVRGRQSETRLEETSNG